MLQRELFIKQTAILSNIQASIIYTVPLYLIHSPDVHRLESYFDTLVLPMIKTYTIEGRDFDEGREILKNIILRRLSDHLIDTDALDLAIEKNGWCSTRFASSNSECKQICSVCKR